MIGEILVLYNTLFNYFLLKFTQEITGLYVKKTRLLFSAFVSGLLASIFHHSLLGTIISFILLIGLAFSFRIDTLLKQGTVLFLATFFLGGLLTSLLPFLLKQSSITFFLLCVSISFLSLHAIHSKWKNIMQSKLQQSFVVDCILTFLGKTFHLKGFIDTGNECIEPLSGKPVHFLSYKALEKQLPKQLKEGLIKWNEKNPYELSMFPTEIHSKIRIVRLVTVQKEETKVLAFRFEQLHVQGTTTKAIHDEYVVFTKNDAKFPQNAQIILHVQAL